jgi:RNA polymerase sigma-70 factor, ECF subfamily
MERRDSGRDGENVRELAVAEAVAADTALVSRVRRGDMDAYGELVRRHMRRAFSIAYGLLRHREDAEDVVQEAFVRTLEQIDRIDPGRPFHPWFHRVVVNLAISYHRARAVRATSPIGEEMASASPAPDQRVEQRELRERLLHALDSLPETQRTIVLLADVENMNSTEIAAVVEMPPGTVRYHLHLGRRALRDSLSAADEEAR